MTPKVSRQVAGSPDHASQTDVRHEMPVHHVAMTVAGRAIAVISPPANRARIG
jgi:hypothetical protein